MFEAFLLFCLACYHQEMQFVWNKVWRLYTIFCLENYANDYVWEQLIMYKNNYHEQFRAIVFWTKIRICVKNSIDASFRDLKIPVIYMVIPTANIIFPRFPNCFLPFSLVFPYVSSGVLTVSSGVSTVSSQCFPCFLF